MPGVILADLCDEALTFHHDGQLVGFCLDNPDEPFGDDFETRLACVRGTFVPIEDFANEDDGIEDEESLRACFGDENDDSAHESNVVEGMNDLYGDYCRMAPSQRAEAIANLRSVILLALDIDKADWNPGDDIVIECMKQSERLSPDDLLSWIEAQYHAATREYDDHIHAALMREQDANVDDEFWMPAHAGGHVKRKQAVQEEENKHHATLKSIKKNERGTSHGKLWWSRTDPLKKSRAYIEYERSKSVADRRETVRTDAEHYFGFAGKGDGFEEYVETWLNLVAWTEMQNAPDPKPWWMDTYALHWALIEEDAHDIYLFDLYGVTTLDRSEDHLHHDLASDVDWDDPFFDYSGPDYPHSQSDDDPYFDFLNGLFGMNWDGVEDRNIGHSSRALIRRGTPRQVLGRMQ